MDESVIAVCGASATKIWIDLFDDPSTLATNFTNPNPKSLGLPQFPQGKGDLRDAKIAST